VTLDLGLLKGAFMFSCALTFRAVSLTKRRSWGMELWFDIGGEKERRRDSGCFEEGCYE
jgi:hypothetical protein